MNNKDFWASVKNIIEEGFTPEGLKILDPYAELFINGKLVYQRFSPFEQHGCSAGGATHVIASLLAGAENQADREPTRTVNDFQRELEQGAQQASCIEQWAKVIGCWTDRVDDLLPRLLGNQIAEGGEAVVYDHGATLIKSIGLDYYLSDMHDENVIRSSAGTIFVVDCDIRINTPELKQGGRRVLTTDVVFSV